MANRTQNVFDDITIDVSLNSGRTVCLRPVRPTDRTRMEDGVKDLSRRSRYLRFFSGFNEAPGPVIDRLVDVDGRRHIAWGAIDLGASEHPAIAAAHAIRENGCSSSGEFALAVLDEFHGQGLARLLMMAVLFNCKVEGIETLTAETLSENRKARRFFKAVGAENGKLAGEITHYRLDVGHAMEHLLARNRPADLGQVYLTLKNEFETKHVT